jgi:Flp pilus assembly protein TadD
MKSELDRQIDRFAGRDLTPAEARQLAQQALDDPDLFDALVASGTAEASLQNPAVSHPARRMPWAIGVAAAAAAILLAFFVWRNPAEPARAVVSKPPVLSKPMTVPSLDAAKGGPILLASALGPMHRADSTALPAFRGDESLDRQPQATGTITQIEDGEATVNLGSLDGLAKGTTLGPIVITTVFRDHARGRIANGVEARVNDPVQVPPALHVAAVLHEVDALVSAGHLNQARMLAQSALAAGSSGETRTLLERLAALDFQAGATDAAREHYEAAANNFFAPPAASPSEQAATLNTLGALYLLRGDPASAVKPLNQAASQTAVDPGLRAQILNNLGVLAEMQGDLAKARDDYSGASVEGVAQRNLARIANLKQP